MDKKISHVGVISVTLATYASHKRQRKTFTQLPNIYIPRDIRTRSLPSLLLNEEVVTNKFLGASMPPTRNFLAYLPTNIILRVPVQ